VTGTGSPELVGFGGKAGLVDAKAGEREVVHSAQHPPVVLLVDVERGSYGENRVNSYICTGTTSGTKSMAHGWADRSAG